MIEGFKTQLDGKGDAGRRGDRVLQPAALERAPAGQRDDRRRGRADATSSSPPRARSPRSPSAATTSPTWSATRTPPPARSRPRTARSREALALLPTTLRRGNSTFVNLRATLDDLDPLVADSKPATKDLAPFLRELRPLVRDAKPTIADLSTLVRRPGADNDLVEATRKLPGFQKRRQPGASRAAPARCKKGQPVLEFVAPVHPGARRLVPRLRRRRRQLRRQRPLRAHPADLQRLPAARAAGRPAAARAAAGRAAARRPADRHAQALPGRGQPARRGRLGAVPRLRRQPRLRSDPGGGRPMMRARRRSCSCSP